MMHSEIVPELIGFIDKELLEGEASDLSADSPILELRILDSLSMVQFLSFVDERFGVQIPETEIVPKYFATVSTIADLIVSLQSEARATQQTSNELRKLVRLQESYGVTSQSFTPDDEPDLQVHSLKVDGDQPTWMMLPGGNPSTSWAPMMRLLAGKQASVAVDLAGFGLSISGKEAPGYLDHVRHMQKYVDSLEGPLVLLANSAGAMIATDLVRSRRERVKALVVTGFGLIDDIDAWWAKVQTLLVEPRLFLDANYHVPPKLTPALGRLLKDVLSRPAYYSFLDDDAREVMPRCFDDLNIPVLMVMGESDDIIPRQCVEDACAKIPNVRMEWMARCGHFPHTERSEQFIYLVNDFLKNI